jgi:hypothetical protein
VRAAGIVDESEFEDHAAHDYRSMNRVPFELLPTELQALHCRLVKLWNRMYPPDGFENHKDC